MTEIEVCTEVNILVFGNDKKEKNKQDRLPQDRLPQD